ncbi:ABC transporter [Trypanosoma grayi]|uniref:ABC transporter n=1 Tax=Trypanosoma grayi TaxID=71804 RepID=UPI0004F450CB|nr:ABC transporter [Trypanosoma grayi]KEG07529.1 ABC transporter [Trypanosoma grayi]
MERHLWEKLRGTNVLLCSVTFSLGVAVAVRWVTNRWASQMRLRNRVVILAFIRKAVEEWEEPCLREVEELLITAPKSMVTTTTTAQCSGILDGDLLFKESDADIKDKESIAPFHGSVRSMAYAHGVDLDQWLRLWRMGRCVCNSLLEDMLLIERLGYIIKYVAFRRLALMAEARYYAAVWRSAVYGGCSDNQAGIHVPKPLIPPWLVGRRPFWIVPLSGLETGRFFCIPLSYFPVETVLTSKAEETWIKELVEMLPEIAGQEALWFLPAVWRKKRTLKLVRSLVELRFPNAWQRLWGEIDRLFNTHGISLAKRQLERHEEACQRFYREKLFKSVELVTGEGIDLEGSEEEASFGQLLSYRERIAGRDVLLRDVSVSGRLQWLLRLRSMSHAVRVAIGLIAPPCSFYAEWLLFSAISSATNNMERERVLAEFSRHVLRGAFAAVSGALLRSLDDAVKRRIYTLLRDELSHELAVKLATVDEAFLRRCIDNGALGSDNPVEKSFMYAENVASQIISRFDYEQRSYMARSVVVLFSVWRREVDIAVFAAVIAMIDYRVLIQKICHWLGITVTKELKHELMRIEAEPLPVVPRYGLRIMMEILADEGKKAAEQQNREGEERAHCRPEGKSSWPFLALVVCGGTFQLEWPTVGFTFGNDDVSKLCCLERLENLFSKVIVSDNNHIYGGSFLPWAPESPTALQKITASPLVESLRLDAACVKEFVLNAAFKTCDVPASTRGWENIGQTQLINSKKAQALLHAEEMELLSDTRAMDHIPHLLSFEDIFDKPPRFILRQLGLETIFAYRAATAVQQRESHSIKETLTDFVSSPFRNMFTQIFLHLLEFIEKVLFFALLNNREKLPLLSWRVVCKFSGGVTTAKTAGWDAISLWGRMGGYSAALKEYGDCSFGPPFRLSQQIARYLPTNLDDTSPIHYAPIFKERRRAWQRKIQRQQRRYPKNIKFDDVGRIIGNFSLTKGIDFCGVYFAYPQLHHHLEDGSLLPALCDVTMKFPAGEMTAIIGETGSGKSTILGLLKRMFDPIPTLCIDEDETEIWRKSEWMVENIRSCLGICLPLPTEEVPLLNLILLDGIPMGCFSTSYLRSGIGMLEQSPCIFEGLSFFQNITLFTPGASIGDVEASAKTCQCEGFIFSRPLGYEALAGELSCGEKQRLSLARAVVSGKGGWGILLLDEPTARLDGYNGGLVEDAVGGVGGCFTAIVVSHRLSTLRSATRVVVLGDGRVAYQGPLWDRPGASLFLQRLEAAQVLRA